MKESLSLLNHIAKTVFDKKGFNILALDVRGVSTLTDYFLIAEGSVDRHVAALAHAVEKELRDHGEKPLKMEGVQEGEWVVLDYGSVIVHLFVPSLREKYRLEELWKEGKIVELDKEILLGQNPRFCQSDSNDSQTAYSFSSMSVCEPIEPMTKSSNFGTKESSLSSSEYTLNRREETRE